MKKKIAISLLSLFIIISISLAFVAPLFVKPIAQEQAQNYINGSIDFDSIAINPLANSVTLNDFTLYNANNKVLATLEEAYINIDLMSLILMSVDVDTVLLKNLQLNIPSEQDSWLNLPLLQVDKTFVSLNDQEVDIENILISALSVSPSLEQDQSLNIDLFINEIDALLISEAAETDIANESLEKPELNSANNTDSSKSETTEQTEELAETAENEAYAETNEDLEEKPWLVVIKGFQLKDANVSFLDKTLSSESNPEGFTTPVGPINFAAQDIHSDLSRALNLTLDIGLLNGIIAVEGSVHPTSLAMELNYELKALQLAKINPYVEHLSYASLESGELTSQGKIINHVNKEDTQEPLTDTTEQTEEQAAEPTQNTERNEIQEVSESDTSPQTEESSQELTLEIENSSTISELKMTHQNYDMVIIECQSIENKELNFKLAENKLNLPSLLIDQCTVNGRLNRDGSTSFDLAKEVKTNTSENNEDKSSTKSKQESSEAIDINIGLFKINDNTVNIDDYSQVEKATITLNNINLEVTDIAQGAPDLTKFNFDSKFNKHAPFFAKGDGNLLNKEISLDTEVKIDKLGLKTFSPYMLGLASRPIEKGVFSMDLDINIIENQLDSKNKLNIQGIELGKKQKTEGASKLPIALAIGILKNSKGEIPVDVPVYGDLNDPNFSILGQVIKTLTGIITKAAAAPLNMVGGIVKGDNTKAINLNFEHSSSELGEDSIKSLNKVAKALNENPEKAIKVNLLLSTDEQEQLADEDSKTTLLSQRKNNISTALTNAGAIMTQIDFQNLSTSAASSDGALAEITFFDR